MNTQYHPQSTEILRRLRNLIRIGTVTQVDTARGVCRVATGQLETDWLHWLTARAGHARTWWAPSVDEQVLLLSIGGDLTTAFILPAIFSDQYPAPSASPEAVHIAFPDGAVMEYEPQSGALTVTGIKTATVNASVSVHVTAPDITCTASQQITLDTPTVMCTNHLTTGSLEIRQGGTMHGTITHTGGQFSSNGIVVDTHRHRGVRSGDGTSGGPVS
ncbi:phage baseplate assembly protein V [Xenorhabdus sp. DI]|uniref:phage baseplate assembly protein V n=1 Tax=Xenorhabdus doucetiae TaxID=351671 RepID=UPI0019AD8536|nr:MULTISPECIES: phage baseplate assembly protein V [unclassified Xenorhabdus]MBD2783786.1 phage baseplate assembly protein V [Xenorhabdus sp. 3]MBD2789973.1 phage baseplate assembly protein V [Xenorhabdus sp. DI]